MKKYRLFYNHYYKEKQFPKNNFYYMSLYLHIEKVGKFLKNFK